MLLEKIILEGISPERALSRLQREGICVYHAKKLKKNQILFSVKRKDTEKVFAIYPNVCYNITVYSPYTARSAGPEGVLALFDRCRKRVGVFLGVLLFAAATLAANQFVLRIDVEGADAYRGEVLAALEESGIRTFALYPSGREREVTAKILALKDVSYCSVEKSGTTVRVEVRLSAFSDPSPQEGDMLAAHSGTILQMAVLRGTALKAPGEEVAAGEPLVGAYLLDGEGEKIPVTAIARVTLSCVYEEVIDASDEQGALAQGYLAADGQIVEKSCERAEGGYLVRIVYTVTETINF